MFKRLKKWLVAKVEYYQQQEFERFKKENSRLKEELMALNGGEPIRLSPEERRLLAQKAKGIDPEIVKQISVFDCEESDPECRSGTSAESP